MSENIRLQISNKGKAMILASIFIILVSCFVPLYQVCMYQENQYNLKLNSQRASELEEDIRVLTASISYSKSPEALITQVIEQKLDYQNIDYNTSYRIARSN